jgi:hypothetical protein
MKVKTIVALFAVIFVAGSLAFAEDQKPFKGWAQGIGDPNPNVDPHDYPYLLKVIQERGEPDGSQIQLFQGINNVGGAWISENVQMFYSNRYPIIDLYEDMVMTVANGDQIFFEIEAAYNDSTGALTGMATIVGGTGRFVGAEGYYIPTVSVGKDGQDLIIVNGYITTVGAAKEK